MCPWYPVQRNSDTNDDQTFFFWLWGGVCQSQRAKEWEALQWASVYFPNFNAIWPKKPYLEVGTWMLVLSLPLASWLTKNHFPALGFFFINITWYWIRSVISFKALCKWNMSQKLMCSVLGSSGWSRHGIRALKTAWNHWTRWFLRSSPGGARQVFEPFWASVSYLYK